MSNYSLMKVLSILGTVVSWISAAPSVSTTFNNAVQYQFDTDGNAIDLTSKLGFALPQLLEVHCTST